MSNKLNQLERKLLHYTQKAIRDFGMIRKKDRVMVCVSGGKDSYTMLYLLNKMTKMSHHDFDIFSFTLDQAQPGWDDSGMRAFLDDLKVPYEILKRDTYSIVKEKIPEGKTYCSLCSRLRRGTIYSYAEEQGYKTIALGHHRDDLISTLLMSIFYSGQTKSMPPKLLTDNQKHLVIRPLVYCQEADIAEFAQLMQFPIIPCNLCGSQENLMRVRVKRLIKELAQENPKVPSNMLHALQSIQPSQLMDSTFWDFKNLKIPETLLAETIEIEGLHEEPQDEPNTTHHPLP